jgi:hypothetical protein
MTALLRFLLPQCWSKGCGVMADKVPVKVLLNQTSRGSPYTATDRLRVALGCVALEFPACGSMERLLSTVLEQLTTDDPRAEWAVQYRTQYNRSLSVGDVVVVGETAWAVEPFGWRPVTVQASQFVDSNSRWLGVQHEARRFGGHWRAWTAAEVASATANTAEREQQ